MKINCKDLSFFKKEKEKDPYFCLYLAIRCMEKKPFEYTMKDVAIHDDEFIQKCEAIREKKGNATKDKRIKYKRIKSRGKNIRNKKLNIGFWTLVYCLKEYIGNWTSISEILSAIKRDDGEPLFKGEWTADILRSEYSRRKVIFIIYEPEGLLEILHREYEKIKNILSKIASKANFKLDENIDLKYLTGLHNSKFIPFWLKYRGLMQDQLKTSVQEEKKISTLVDQILAAKKKDRAADTSALERKIDEMVYELYGLTREDIAIMEGRE